MKIERRSIATAINSEKEGTTLTGYAAMYGRWTDIGTPTGSFRECIRQGAFDQSLANKSNVRALFNHDPNMLLATSGSGTLALVSDDKGLAFRLDIPNTPTGQEVKELVKRGDLVGCSFAWLSDTEKDSWKGNNRELLQCDLIDVSICTYPAYSQTSVDLRMVTERSLYKYNLAMRRLKMPVNICE